jgi:ribokinase
MSRVVVVGSVNVDLTVKVAALPSPGETVIGGEFTQSPGGKGGNQATAAARLGAETWFVGLVGDDPFGKSARADLEASGVNVTHLGTGGSPTGVAAIIVDEGGENLIAVASGANGELEPGVVERALGGLLSENTVVLGGLEVPDEAVAAAARAARRAGACFVLNPAPAHPLPEELIRACDVLTPNEHEAAVLVSGSPEMLLDQGAAAVVVTQGARGADLLRPGASAHHQPPFPIDAVDTTGAGDAFSAALAWGLSEGRSLEDAIALGAAAGALATRAVGARAALPTRQEVEGLLSR